MSGLCFDRGKVPAVLERSAMVEPVDPLGGGDLEVVEALPRPLLLDQLGLVEADDGLGQRIDAPIDGKWSGCRRKGLVDGIELRGQRW